MDSLAACYVINENRDKAITFGAQTYLLSRDAYGELVRNSWQVCKTLDLDILSRTRWSELFLEVLGPLSELIAY